MQASSSAMTNRAVFSSSNCELSRKSLARARTLTIWEASPGKVILRRSFNFLAMQWRIVMSSDPALSKRRLVSDGSGIFGGSQCQAVFSRGVHAFCDPLPKNKSHWVGDCRQKQCGGNNTNKEGHRRARERGEKLGVFKADRLASSQDASQPILKVDAEGKGEGIADPCACDGCRYICPEEEGAQGSGDHLDREWHECEERSNRQPKSKFLACWMPQLVRKKTISENPVDPCAANVLGSRQVAQVSANLATPPLYGFHFVKRFSVVLMLATQDRF